MTRRTSSESTRISSRLARSVERRGSPAPLRPNKTGSKVTALVGIPSVLIRIAVQEADREPATLLRELTRRCRRHRVKNGEKR